MTRPWGSHTRSANGAKKRTDHKALGPSRVVPALWRTGAASLLSYPSKNGRLWLGIQSGYASVAATRYRCYDPSGGGCGAPPSLAADTLNPDRIVYVEASDDGKWFTTIIDNDEQYIPSPSHEDLGLYVYEAMGATTACYARLYVQTAGDFAESVQIPHDTSDDVTLLVCTGDAALEADMQEGPSCSGTWEAGDPPATLNYRAAGTPLSVQYFVYSRATAADAWTLVGGPWDRPSYTTTGFTVSQTTGLLWWRSGATEIKCWNATTQYSAASVTTITIPAGNIYGWWHWGEHTFISSTNGNIYVYVGSTYKMAVPAPLDPATWDYAESSYGWLLVTEYYNKVHFYRLTDDGVEFRQTLTYQSADVYGFVDAACVSEDCAVSGTWSRFLYNHSTGLWEHGGHMPHVMAKYADGWTWIGTVDRHLIMRKELTYPDEPLPDASWDGYYYDLVQVI